MKNVSLALQVLSYFDEDYLTDDDNEFVVESARRGDGGNVEYNI